MKVLHHETRTETRVTPEVGDDNVTRDVEKVLHILHSVTFEDFLGSVHTLTFHPAGTNTKAHSDDPDWIVGKDVPYHEFMDADEAVMAFYKGLI
jgi:hypothetical protein